jgi:hypothetical protein
MKKHRSRIKSEQSARRRGWELKRSTLDIRPSNLWPFAFLILNFAFFSTAYGQGAQGAQIKQRAKELVNQNNVRQGVPPPAAPAPRPASTATPGTAAAPNPAVLQAQNISKIESDLAALKPGSLATVEQKQQFIKDLAVAARTTKPSLPTVTKFVDTLTAALGENSLGEPEQKRLAQNLNAVFNSKPLPAAQFDAIIADVQAILQVGGVKQPAAANIAANLKAVGVEVRR